MGRIEPSSQANALANCLGIVRRFSPWCRDSDCDSWHRSLSLVWGTVGLCVRSLNECLHALTVVAGPVLYRWFLFAR